MSRVTGAQAPGGGARWAAATLLLTLLGACEANMPPGEVGTRMPAYTAVDLEGNAVSLESFRGDVVLLNVWATWCAPCRREIPELQALSDRFSGEGLRVVGVSLDAPGSNERVREFLDEFGVEYAILRDPHEVIGGMLGVVGMPTTVLLDREGMIRWRHLGAVSAQDATLLAALEKAL